MAKQQQRPPAQPTQRTSAAVPRRSEQKRVTIFSAGSSEMLYSSEHFIIMGIGLLLVIAGLIAMAGGGMTDPNTWNEAEIYSFRRITVAPILMVLGFLVVIYGIFKKPGASKSENESAA